MTFELLKEEYKALMSDIKEVYSEKHKKINAIKDQYAPLEKSIQERADTAFEKYFDTVLVDAEGNTIKQNDFLFDGKSYYKVIDRSMQNIFGHLIENPGIEALKLDKGFTPGKKKHRFSRTELKDFKIYHFDNEGNYIKN